MPKERVERDEEDLVRLYLTDIGQYPLLTKDDEVRLAQQIESGNAARGELEDPKSQLAPARKTQLKREIRRGEDAERTGGSTRVSCSIERGVFSLFGTTLSPTRVGFLRQARSALTTSSGV